MIIDIIIDTITDCLIDTETGLEVSTMYERVRELSATSYKGWKFDWSIPVRNGYDIYELFVKGIPDVQGRIAVRKEHGYMDVDIVETAPHNFGHAGKYSGVGGHLFAIACKLSFEAGFDGYVAFTAKSDLIKHYQKELGARVLFGQRMEIASDAAAQLVKKYF